MLLSLQSSNCQIDFLPAKHAKETKQLLTSQSNPSRALRIYISIVPVVALADRAWVCAGTSDRA